jgi:hypothetical protein
MIDEESLYLGFWGYFAEIGSHCRVAMQVLVLHHVVYFVSTVCNLEVIIA